MVNLAKQP